MNLFFKFLIVALVLAVLLPFTVLKGKDGRPLMSLGDLKAPELSLPQIPEATSTDNAASKSVSMPSAEGKDIVYKWRDEKGELHFSSSPPPEGFEYTAKGYDPNTNLIQSLPVQSEATREIGAAEQKGEIAVNEDAAEDEIGNPYSPEKVKKLMKDAKNIQKMLDDRFKQQEALMGR